MAMNRSARTVTAQDHAPAHHWRDRPWLDLVIAGFSAIAMSIVHVSTRGDALSSLGRGERRAFYAVLAVVAVVLLGSSLKEHFPAARWCRGCLGFAVASALAATLLDVQNSPARIVQVIVLFGLFLTVTATLRLVLRSDDPSDVSPGSVRPSV